MIGPSTVNALAEQAAAEQAELAKLSPDKQWAIKFEDLVSRRPQKSEIWSLLPDWLCKRLGHEDRLLVRQEAWQAELQVLIMSVDLDLMVPGSNLSHVLLRHHRILLSDVSALIRGTNQAQNQQITNFGNRLQKLVEKMGAAKLAIQFNVWDYEDKYGAEWNQTLKR